MWEEEESEDKRQESGRERADVCIVSSLILYFLYSQNRDCEDRPVTLDRALM